MGVKRINLLLAGSDVLHLIQHQDEALNGLKPGTATATAPACRRGTTRATDRRSLHVDRVVTARVGDRRGRLDHQTAVAYTYAYSFGAQEARVWRGAFFFHSVDSRPAPPMAYSSSTLA